MRGIICSIALWALLVLGGCGDDAGPIQDSGQLEAYLLDEMEAQHMPALAVMVFKDNEILYQRYFGKSQIADDVALNGDQVFLLASVSKVFTATALLQLYDEGKFKLDDPINDYLDFDVSIPDETKPITFRMLLTHTSAIADGSALDDQYYDGEDSPVALGDFMKDYFSPEGQYYDEDENFHAFGPGEEHEYSNVASALIGVLVEQISGMGFNEFCKERIFTPLGMARTSWRLDEVTSTLVQPYSYSGGEYEEIEHYTFTDYPNGGLRSTPRDLFAFLKVVLNNGTLNGDQLLKSSTLDEMMTPQIPDIDDQVGLHMFIMDDERELWGHDGGEKGVATIMAFNRSNKVGVILLTNQGDANLDELLLESYDYGASFSRE